MSLAVATGIAPDVWDRQEPAAVLTAVELLRKRR